MGEVEVKLYIFLISALGDSVVSAMLSRVQKSQVIWFGRTRGLLRSQLAVVAKN
jgi:hypothetical protein